ncbi:hypothetical protein ACFX13_010748 [Malus domestica]
MGPSGDQNTPQSEVTRDTIDGEGAHVMKLSIGTPPFDIYTVADTGSSLIWTQCEPCPGCYKQKKPMFDPRKSSTYHIIPCYAPECNATIDDFSCSRSGDQNVCSYNYVYMDQSKTQGVVAKDTITLASGSGKPVSFKEVVFGCGHNNTGENFSENLMGMVGLGLGNTSLVSQIAPYVGGRKFSHCLVPFDPDHPNAAGTLSFGNGSEVTGEGAVSTPLIIKDQNDRYAYQYHVTVEGISVGTTFVPFDSSGSVSKGNMFLDSGTQVTVLPQDFYGQLMEQVKKAVDLKPVLVGDPKNGTRFCYNTSTLDHLKGATLTVHFEGGGKVKLTPEQAFFHTEDDGYKLLCSMLMNGTEVASEDVNVAIYGSNAQSNFWVGFDLERMMVSFKPTDCRRSGGDGNSSGDGKSTGDGKSSSTVIHFSYFYTCLFNFLLIFIFSL